MELLIKLLSSLGLILIGIMGKFSVNDGWQSAKKYWIYFVLLGGLSLAFQMYKLLV
ncbi:hypothetical protein B0O44_104513 [Pedobacter nutrimenti]|jgi:hypothetical protein|uniref:Uncharacterized protein n=1 Tax=Pedobacter nutrimenti TaxID=1241337 RepID=A0A318UD32_9SPHI|nr:hypothetical protein B0O44_104513 [Pedobacter nutrimenti]